MSNLLVAHLRVGDTVILIDVLEAKDGLWLIPAWTDSEDGKSTTPARAIRLDGLRFQREGVGGADITVNQDIPQEVLDGRSFTDGRAAFEVVIGTPERFGWIEKRLVS